MAGFPPDADRAYLDRLLPSLPLLRAYLRLQVGDHADLDDLVQEVSVALWRRWQDYDPERPFVPWMLAFARHHLLRWREDRARARRVLALDDEAHAQLTWAADRVAEEGSRGEALARCLQTLDEASGRLLRWRYADGLDLAAIAKRLGAAVATISRRLQRVRDRLELCIRRRTGEGEAP